MYIRAVPNAIRTVPIELPTKALSNRPTNRNIPNPPSVINTT